MFPNLHPPIDRSEEARQGVYTNAWERAPEQAFGGGVHASFSLGGLFNPCDLLPEPMKSLCKMAT